jgi:WD40 repeat protein
MLPGDRAVVAFHRMVGCWDLISGEELWRSRCYGELMGVAASPLGDLVVVDGVSVSTILDAATGEASFGPDDLSHFTFSPDGDTLYAYDCNSQTVVNVDMATEEIGDTGLEFGEPEEDDCYSLTCCPTRPLLASGGDHGRVRLGDPVAGRWLHITDGPPGFVSNLAFSPDGRTLVSGHDDRVVFWDVDTMVLQAVLRLPGYGVSALAFGPDGETLAIGDTQGVVRLWPWRRTIGAGRYRN